MTDMRSFMARPTEDYEQYLAYSRDRDLTRIRNLLRWGRIAMALEIVTVIRLLEDHNDLVTHAEETISVLQTLLVDQGLAEDAMVWYEKIHEWRKPKLALVSPESEYDADDAGPDVPASEHATPPDAGAHRGANDAQPGSDQRTGPSSSW